MTTLPPPSRSIHRKKTDPSLGLVRVHMHVHSDRSAYEKGMMDCGLDGCICAAHIRRFTLLYLVQTWLFFYFISHNNIICHVVNAANRNLSKPSDRLHALPRLPNCEVLTASRILRYYIILLQYRDDVVRAG